MYARDVDVLCFTQSLRARIFTRYDTNSNEKSCIRQHIAERQCVRIVRKIIVKKNVKVKKLRTYGRRKILRAGIVTTQTFAHDGNTRFFRPIREVNGANGRATSAVEKRS